MARPPVLIVGAGAGGLATAMRLAAAGRDVRVLEKGASSGGKIRAGDGPGTRLDTGPTVLTLPWVFDELFGGLGRSLREAVDLEALEVLAHHRWVDGSCVDLYAEPARTRESLRAFAGDRAVRDYERFARRARAVYSLLESAFLRRQQRGLSGLLGSTPLRHWAGLGRLQPFRSLWSVLGDAFADPRLRQLFARYATYCGSSPFAAPATLMLIAHVEQAGVYRVRGGIRALAGAMQAEAEAAGAVFEFGRFVEEILVRRGRVAGVRCGDGATILSDTVVVNADTQALADGVFGPGVQPAVARSPIRMRSLSAITYAGEVPELDLPALHNVLFSDDYPAEFDALQARRIPAVPTIYAYAPDSGAPGLQRLLLLVNAPADGDTRAYDESIRKVQASCISARLREFNLHLPLDALECTTPDDYHRRYPATGGALYGPAMHGWRAAFRRPGNRTRIPGLLVAGGSVHPGSGVPMAALSGSLAADCVLADEPSLHGVTRGASVRLPQHAG